MRRICLLPLLFALCLLFCSCTSVLCSGEDYQLLKADGKYYIQFHTDYSHEKFMASLPQELPSSFYPTYASVSELQEALLGGKVPYYALAGLNAKAATEPLEILNPERLYNVKLPEGLTVEAVQWKGDRYDFLIPEVRIETEPVYDAPPGVQHTQYAQTVEVCVLSRGEYERVLMEQYQNAGIDSSCVTLELEQHSYRNSKKLRYCTGSGSDTAYYAAYFYEFQTPQGIRYICEIHKLPNETLTDVMSAGIAYHIDPVVHMLWSDGSGCFWVKATLQNMSVTDDWINGFQLLPVEQ